MTKRLLVTVLLVFGFFSFTVDALAQNEYRYSLNLNKVEDDALTVELLVPKLQKSTLTFSFPKIIPGTYAISDYGKFISAVNAFDNTGKKLQVKKISENKWRITDAMNLARLTYNVQDIFDTDIKHGIYPMAATNIEEGRNFVIHTPGFFGYFDGYNNLPFNITIDKPENLYGSTSLISTGPSLSKDIFRTENLDALYDSPIMYTIPDTTTLTVGNCKVLVSVYSPGKLQKSKEIAGWMSDLLDATRQYLGGRLPADKYSFLYYFKDTKLEHSFPSGTGGALEHTTSSFYYLPDVSPAVIKNSIVHASSHEFFHIITPLTIASKEVKEFNYDEPILSKHLWLYEGVTEYTSNYVQAKYGLISPEEYLDILSDKITSSRKNYNDTLPFTKLSKEAASKYESQYGNVYQKGALIAACLDIYLLHLSGGTYSLRNLTYDLGVRFGKKRYFNDDELFSEIKDLTYPEIEDFLKKYVSGSAPIPYEYFFGLAGIKFTPKAEKKTFSIGGVAPTLTSKGVIAIAPQSPFNDFGKKVGYQPGDELYAINGVALTPRNILQAMDSVKSVMKEGDNFIAKVGRKNAVGGIDTLQLQAKVFKATQYALNKLEPLIEADDKQKFIQHAWLTASEPNTASASPANSNDVNTIDAIIKATYEVISGPAGARNWERFNSLFLPGAKLGASSGVPGQPAKFRSFTPTDYRKANAPFFMQSGFYEEELNRKVSQFGNVASVASAYQFRTTFNGKPEQRGINYFTLVYSDGRWWISNLVWQDEDGENKLPGDMEKKQGM